MDFKERIRGIRQEGHEEGERREHERDLAARRVREVAERVRQVADEIHAHIERRLEEFRSEFVEFRLDAFTREGRNFRAFWDEPVTSKKGKPESLLHQLSFRVRPYPEYADIEVTAKAIVRNRECRRRSRKDDVREGGPARLLGFVDEEILEFARLYSSPD